MKTIGIITIHNSLNYGASLQSYALLHFLLEKGFDCQIIDLYRPEHKGFENSIIHKPYFKHSCTFKKKFINILKSIVSFTFPIWHRDIRIGYEEAKKKFVEFNRRLICSKSYYSVDSLYKDIPVFDVYITGSDQVWNPQQPFCIEPYFLTFAPLTSKRISYASSIGITSLPAAIKKDFQRWLSMYDAISVREKQGKKLLENITSSKIEQMPDPTFLVAKEHWMELAILPCEIEPYIVVFSLRMNDDLFNYADLMARKNRCKLIILGHFQRKYSKNITCDIIRNVGPREFLGYISKAACVLTDSFHGTVFSILLESRNFFSYIPSQYSSAMDRSSRIVDLLDSFELQNHLIYNLTELDVVSAYNNIIETNAIRKLVLQESQKGQKFLLENIG